METSILLNQKLDDSRLETIRSLGTDDDPVLWAVVGEISQKAKYAKCVLLATSTRIFTYDFGTEECSDSYKFSDVKEIFNKRMYGNGIMRIRTQDGVLHDVFRFTFSVAALCDAAITYVTGIRDGETVSEALATMQAVYEKLLSVCPKCGRTLAAPGAPCIHCMKKRRLVSRLGGYLKPEAPILVISVIVSIITTALALVPPLLTRTLVDDILPNRNTRLKFNNP